MVKKCEAPEFLAGASVAVSSLYAGWGVDSVDTICDGIRRAFVLF